MAGDLKCECGGTLKHVTLERYDFSPFAGLRADLVKVPGFRCSRCKGETIDGETIVHALNLLILAIVRMPNRVSSEHARYLRKRMHLTQKELADRMGLARETVADWERGSAPISAQHDFILRGLAFASLGKALKKSDIKEVLGRVRGEPANDSERATALVLDDFRVA